MAVGRGLRDDRERWRHALERMGVDQVRQILRERPDRPLDEPFPNLLPDPPFPTRGFAQDWLLEQENRIIRLSKSTIFIIIAAIMVVLMGWFASSSFQNALPQPPSYVAPAVQAQQQ
jgi:hypothetical protein